MPSSPPRTMGSRAESYCSSTLIPIVGSGLCHAVTVIVSSSRFPLKNQRMIGILLNLISFVRVSASAGPQYCDSDAGSYADSADELHSDAAAGLYSESADCDSTGTCMLIVRASSVLLEIALTTTEFRICAFPAQRVTATSSGASRLCDALMSSEKAHQSE
jgi:hypothetical protein